MSSLTNHKRGFIPSNKAVLSIALIFSAAAFSAQVSAQGVGVFDPSKVMVAKDKATQMRAIEQNIAMANEFNRTLGTPDHPRSNAPEPEQSAPPANMRAEAGPPSGSPPPPSIPDFDLPPDVRKRNEARARNRRSREKPSVEANKVNLPPPAPPEEPTVSANPVSIRGMAPAFENPVPEAPQPSDPDLEFAAAPEASGRKSFFSRFKKSSPTSPSEIDVSTPDAGNADLPPGEVSVNGELDHIPADQNMAAVPGSDGELIPLDDSDFSLPSGDGLALPSHGEMPEERRSGFLGMFSRSKNRTYDVPSGAIPISIGSNNSGNPYSNSNFDAAPGFSPFFDDPSQRGQMRDMTVPGSHPLGESIAGRMAEKPLTDVSQYLVVKEDTTFEPFIRGSEEVDKDGAFEIYSGMAVRDLGIVGLKRMVQIDSGETGLIKKFDVRELSVSEEAVMSNGLKQGRPWYSILDTEADYGEFAANLSPRPMTTPGSKPQRAWGQQKELSNGKPDSDVSQYYVVKRSNVTFAPFAGDSDDLDLASAFDMPTGAVVKMIKTSGSNYVIQSDSGEFGVVPVDGVRPLNGSEKTLMTGGIDSGRPWYSILDTEADAMASAEKPRKPMISKPDKPADPQRPKPKAIAAKPESDVSQYYLVKKDGIIFNPFTYGTSEIDTDSSFEMYGGAVVKVLTTAEGKHVVRTDSGETGVIGIDGLRPLNEKEKEAMGKGISNGRPWYSILDTIAE